AAVRDAGRILAAVNPASAFCINLRIGRFQELIRGLSRLNIGSMVDELLDWNLLGNFCQTSEVIAMPMRDDEVIQLPKARRFDRCQDASGIAYRGRVTGVAGINQDG